MGRVWTYFALVRSIQLKRSRKIFTQTETTLKGDFTFGQIIDKTLHVPDNGCACKLLLGIGSYVVRAQTVASTWRRAIDHARWLIRTPRLSCADQGAWAVVTPKWPKANSNTLRRVTLTHAASRSRLCLYQGANNTLQSGTPQHTQPPHIQ